MKQVEQKIARMRAKIEAARERANKMDAELRAKYAPDAAYNTGSIWEYRMPRGKREALNAAHTRVWDLEHELIEYIASVSPRGQRWMNSAPAAWIVRELSIADVLTSGALSTLPPTPYGGSVYSVRAFASADWARA